MRSALFTLICVTLFIGCATVKSAAPAANPQAEAPKVPNITINYPNEFWSVMPPEMTPPGCAQYAVNRITGAELDIRVMPGEPLDFARQAEAVLKKNGTTVSEITVAADGSASFTFTAVKGEDTIKGKFTAVAPKALPGATMPFFGYWPEIFNESMVKDFDYITSKFVIE